VTFSAVLTGRTSPTVRYPAGPISKHGAYYLLKGTHPEMTLAAYDGSIAFHLMGGQSIPNRDYGIESAQIQDLSGLIPPWQTVDQKGATEDGVTFLDALYDPCEVDMTLLARGSTAAGTRRVVRDLIASIDAKQKSRLSWMTHELGYWWADLRWLKGRPPDKMLGAQKRRQKVTLNLRVDDSFWRSFDDVDDFRLVYDLLGDSFSTTTDQGLPPGWKVGYSPAGGGYVRCVNGQLTFVPAREIQPQNFTVVCQRTDNGTATDNQVVQLMLGNFPGWAFPEGAAIDLWGRMNQSGPLGATGIRARIEADRITLSSFVNGVEKIIRVQDGILPPMPGELFTLVCGDPTNSRRFEVLRGGANIFTAIESGSTSRLGAGLRGTGLGMWAQGDALDAVPPSIQQWSAGDNTIQTQRGFLRRVNIGDQPMFDRYTCFGPGTFVFANGPGSTDYVRFGPLLPGQIMHLRSDPRKAGVVDLTSTPATPQDQAAYNKAVEDYLSFATANNASALLSQIDSIFGVPTAQGNPFTLLQGRFSDDAAIPAKSPGNPASPYTVAVQIENGNADSAIVVSGTPLRRYPI
jgi:hypothetical protein